MKHLLSSAVCLTVLSVTAFADTRLTDVKTHAGNVERDSKELTTLLKGKQFDLQTIQTRISSIGGEIGNIQKVVDEIEASNARFVEGRGKEWQLFKENVQLLSISHNNKVAAATAENPRKNRALLMAYAKGQIKRAEMLNEASQRLLR